MKKLLNNSDIKSLYKDGTISYDTQIEEIETKVEFTFNPDREIAIGENFIIKCNITSNKDLWIIEVRLDRESKFISTTNKYNEIKPVEIFGEISVGNHDIQIIVYEDKNEIARQIYKNIPIKYESSIIIKERNQMPYISTYHIDPILEINKEWQIEIFIDDYWGSYYKEYDLNQKFNLYITIDGFEDIVYRGISAGDRFITMPAFTEYGEYEFSLQCEDMQGRKSHTLWNEVWVKPEIPVNEYIMTEEDLVTYGITNKKIETIVPVYIAPEEFTAGQLINTRDTILASKPEVINYQVPSGEYVLFMPDLDNDGEYDYYGGWIRNVQYIKYADDYNQDDIDLMASNNQIGLQKFIDDKIAEGYNKLTFIKDAYFIVAPRVKLDGEGHGSDGSIYIQADNFTLDLNGSTIKLNRNALATSLILNLNFSFNSHVINGYIEGDAFTHDYANSPNNSEWNQLAGLKGGSKYSSIENIVMSHSAGYGYVGGGTTAKRDNTTGYTIGNIVGIGALSSGDLDENGELIEATDRCVSDFKDVSGTINGYKTYYNKNFGMFQISLYLGYQGNGAYNWNYKLFEYDENKVFIREQVGYQYRCLKMHENTKYIRVVGLAPAANVGSGLNAVYFTRPINCWTKNITVKETRGTGGAWTGMSNCLFENMDFICCGNHVTPVGFDMEDGWDQMQDATYRNVNFYKRPGTADLMTTAGHNIIVENMQSGSYYAYGRTRNYVVRNCNMTIGGTCEVNSHIRTGIPRIFNNTFNTTYNLNSVVKNCKMVNGGNAIVKNCNLDNLGGNEKLITDSTVTFKDEGNYLNGSLNVVNTVFNTEGIDYIRLRFNHYNNANIGLNPPSFYNCEFNSHVILDDHTSHKCSYYENCTFNNGFKLRAEVSRTPDQWVEFKNCIINNIDNYYNYFIETGDFAYSTGKMNIKFTNCTINKIGSQPFLYDYSLSDIGNIVFDNCKLNIEDECELFKSIYNTATRGYKNLRFTFINTEFPSNFNTQNITNSNGGIKIEII